MPAISLIVATYGRSAELSMLIASLRDQTYTDFELVVVDQNTDDRVAKVLAADAKDLAVNHIRTSPPALCRARNIGIRHAEGSIVGFPDDDAVYEPDVLERLAESFANHPEIGLMTAQCLTEKGEQLPFMAKRSEPCGLDRRNFWLLTNSSVLFARRTILQRVNGFDERLGLNAATRWRAGEELDLTLRALPIAGGLHVPAARIRHPNKWEVPSEAAIRKSYEYGLAMGWVLRVHGFPLPFVFRSLMRPFGAAVAALTVGRIGRSRDYFARFRGRFLGWLGSGGERPMSELPASGPVATGSQEATTPPG